MGDLGARLADLNEQLKAQAPQDLVRLYDDGVAEMLATTAGDNALNLGHRAPAVDLSDLAGSRISLDRARENGPVILLFFRGGWCPFCKMQLSAMNDALAEISTTGASLLALTPEQPESARQTLGDLGLRFPVLYDETADVARSYGLVFTLNAKLQELQVALGAPLSSLYGTTSQELPVPATFIVGQDGLIAWRHVDRDYRLKRAEPSDILAALNKTHT